MDRPLPRDARRDGTSLTQLTLEILHQVLGLLLLDGEVGVARHAEQPLATDREAREERVHVVAHDLKPSCVGKIDGLEGRDSPR